MEVATQLFAFLIVTVTSFSDQSPSSEKQIEFNALLPPELTDGMEMIENDSIRSQKIKANSSLYSQNISELFLMGRLAESPK